MALGNAVDAQTTGFQSLNAATGVWNGRTLTPGTGISITNQDGTGGNPVISSTGSNPPFDPSTGVFLYDDFIGSHYEGSNFLISQCNWYSAAAERFNPDETTILQSNNHPGIITNDGNLNTNQYCSLTMSYPGANPYTGLSNFVIGGGAISLTWIFHFSALSPGAPRWLFLAGMSDNTLSTIVPVNAIYISYSDNLNSGNWQYITTSASVETRSNSAVAATTGWHKFNMVINAAATSVEFFMDGVSLGTNTTNIPTAGSIQPGIVFFDISGTVAAEICSIDAFWLSQTLTTPR